MIQIRAEDFDFSKGYPRPGCQSKYNKLCTWFLLLLIGFDSHSGIK